MNGPLLEWIAKAEEDYRIAVRSVRYRRLPTYAGVCFHCQQCAEKYLKGLHIRLGLTFTHTHDLERLLDLLVKTVPALGSLRKDIEDLNLYSVTPRYPGFAPTVADAQNAVAAMKRVRLPLRKLLGVHRNRKRAAAKKPRTP